jgi:hypothetical protein
MAIYNMYINALPCGYKTHTTRQSSDIRLAFWFDLRVCMFRTWILMMPGQTEKAALCMPFLRLRREISQI